MESRLTKESQPQKPDFSNNPENFNLCISPNRSRPIVKPNEKIPVFRVTRPYLNLLVKPSFFSGFLENI